MVIDRYKKLGAAEEATAAAAEEGDWKPRIPYGGGWFEGPDSDNPVSPYLLLAIIDPSLLPSLLLCTHKHQHMDIYGNK